LPSTWALGQIADRCFASGMKAHLATVASSYKAAQAAGRKSFGLSRVGGRFEVHAGRVGAADAGSQPRSRANRMTGMLGANGKSIEIESMTR